MRLAGKKAGIIEKERFMALVKCKECGSEISDTATICPQCGYSKRVVQPVGNQQQSGLSDCAFMMFLVGLSWLIVRMLTG